MTVNDSEMCVRWKDEAWSIPEIFMISMLSQVDRSLQEISMTDVIDNEAVASFLCYNITAFKDYIGQRPIE